MHGRSLLVSRIAEMQRNYGRAIGPSQTTCLCHRAAKATSLGWITWTAFSHVFKYRTTHGHGRPLNLLTTRLRLSANMLKKTLDRINPRKAQEQTTSQVVCWKTMQRSYKMSSLMCLTPPWSNPLFHYSSILPPSEQCQRNLLPTFQPPWIPFSSHTEQNDQQRTQSPPCPHPPGKEGLLSSAFNTIKQQQLICKLHKLEVNTSLCNCY